MGINPRIELVYQLYCDAFEQLRRFPEITTPQSNRDFCGLLKHMLNQHAVVIPQLAAGMAECSEHLTPVQMDLFMNDMLRTRIGRRVLAEQHICLTEHFHSSPSDGGAVHTSVGLIDTGCDASSMVDKCSRLAHEFLLAKGIAASKLPRISVNGHRDDVKFRYIPDHIEYILFELLKNALYFQSISGNCKRPVQVTISSSSPTSDPHSTTNKFPVSPAAGDVDGGSSSANITFRISDQGGGFSRDLLLPDNPQSIWSFSHCQRYFMRALVSNSDLNRHPTGMPHVSGKLSDPPSSLTNIRIGLQLARVFANYWGGDLKICTMYGFGSDAYVRIVTGGEHEERLTTEKSEIE